MDSPKRTLVKALTWQGCGLIVMSLLGYAMTGSWEAAGGYSLGAAALGLATFVLHERLWNRIAWGRAPTERGAEAQTAAQTGAQARSQARSQE
ncbi:MAG: DUF2061 domain-containing protein [Pseudomonadota bacterium]